MPVGLAVPTAVGVSALLLPLAQLLSHSSLYSFCIQPPWKKEIQTSASFFLAKISRAVACVLPTQTAQSFLNQAPLVYRAEHWQFYASMVFCFLINQITGLQKLGMKNYQKPR